MSTQKRPALLPMKDRRTGLFLHLSRYNESDAEVQFRLMVYITNE